MKVDTHKSVGVYFCGIVQGNSKDEKMKYVRQRNDCRTRASPIAGDNKSYYEYLDKLNLLAGKKEEQKPQEVFHTDRGAVYSLRAFQHAHKDDNITSFDPCRKGNSNR